MTSSIDQYAEQLYLAHKGERIISFYFQEHKFWLKQPEQLTFIEQFLKPHPKASFLDELHRLQELTALHAPIPKLVCYTEHYFVLEDAGRSVSDFINDNSVSNELKMQILQDTIQALIRLHKQGIVHGRPAIRDITWHQGDVKFIDFESHSNSHNLDWLIVRDILLFFDNLCRKSNISDEMLQQIAQYYQHECPAHYWTLMLKYIKRFRWLYYLLLPFKPIAKTDLLAIYRLFEIFTK